MDFSQEFYFIKALSHYQLEEYTYAMQNFQKIIELNPENELAYHYLIESKKFNYSLENNSTDFINLYINEEDNLEWQLENLIFLIKERDRERILKNKINERDTERIVSDKISKLKNQFPNNNLIPILMREIDAQKSYNDLSELKNRKIKLLDLENRKNTEWNELDTTYNNKFRQKKEIEEDYHKKENDLEAPPPEQETLNELMNKSQILATELNALSEEINPLIEETEKLSEELKTLSEDIEKANNKWIDDTKESLRKSKVLKSWMNYTKEIYERYNALPESKYFLENLGINLDVLDYTKIQ